jgi:hypothetical protein
MIAAQAMIVSLRIQSPQLTTGAAPGAASHFVAGGPRSSLADTSAK